VPRPAPAPDRASLVPEEREAFDQVLAKRDNGYYRALVNSPRVAQLVSRLGAVYREVGETGRSYSDAEREWIDLVLSHELACPFSFAAHVRSAVASGVRPEAIAALLDGRDGSLTEAEGSLARYVRAVHAGEVTAEQWADAEGRWGVRGAVEVTAFAAHIVMTIRLIQGLGADDSTLEEVEQLVAEVVG
jgi:AhpD family alkylhydroperoxidase